jgi:hypothetical protein
VEDRVRLGAEWVSSDLCGRNLANIALTHILNDRSARLTCRPPKLHLQ